MIEPKMPLRLMPSERETALWGKLSKHYKEKLQELRERNDGALSESDTARLRGNIDFCKAFLALADELPPIDGQR